MVRISKCQKGWNIPRNVFCKSEVDRLTKSLSRLLLSSKFPPGVFEDMDIPETHGDGVIRIETSQEIFPASLKLIG